MSQQVQTNKQPTKSTITNVSNSAATASQQAETKLEKTTEGAVSTDTATTESKANVEELTTNPSTTFDDRHGYEDPYRNVEPLEYNISQPETYEARPTIRNPITSNGKMEAAFTEINTLGDEAIKKKYSDDEIARLADYADRYRYTTKHDEYLKRLNENIEKFINHIQYGDKHIVPKLLDFVEKQGVISGEMAIARFRNILSAGDIVQVPLWHSGFWVTITPPTQKELIILYNNIMENFTALGKSTFGAVFAHSSVIYIRILTDFILDHIESTTVKLPEGISIESLIVIQDFEILLLALISAMYPKGIIVERTCVNSSRLDDNYKPKCDSTVKATLDPRKLLFVDRTSLTKNMLAHMAERRVGATSVDAVKDYQLSIEQLIDKAYDLTASNDKVIRVTFGLPKLDYYVRHGEEWVNNITAEAEKIFTENDTDDQKQIKISSMVAGVALGLYSTFVKKIEIADEGFSVMELKTINGFLDTMSADEDIYSAFITNVREFIEVSCISKVATPNYICPKCGEAQMENGKSWFNELIPLNLLEHFFILCGLEFSKIRTREIPL